MQSSALESRVHYQVTVDPHRHEIAVDMRLTGPNAEGDVRLEVPTWVPGDYSFAPLARDLFNIRAMNANGEPLDVSRDGWQAFRIRGCKGEIVVQYQVNACATELGESSGIVDGKYAILLGARYLHCPAHLGACTVSYQVPKEWEGAIHHPSGVEKLGTTNTWRYPSFEILLDTPVVMGHFDRIERIVHVSGIDASLTAYLNHSPKYSGRTSNAIDYYDHGMLVGFEVDAALRFADATPSTLDDAMSGFYRKYAGYGVENPGYTTQDALDYFGSLSPQAGELVASAIKKPEGLHVERMLAQIGFGTRNSC